MKHLFLFLAIFGLYLPFHLEAADKNGGCHFCEVEGGKLSAGELQSFTVIDVRSPGLYERLHAPGSINLPSFALKTREYLKNRKLLLIGNSWARGELGKLCGSLLEAGFVEVKVLKGGLPAWAQEIGKLQGIAEDEGKLKVLSPQALYREAALRPWVLFDLSEHPLELLSQSLTKLEVVRLPMATPFESFKRALISEVNRKRKETPELGVALLYSPAKPGLEIDLKLLQAAPELQDVFLVDGGHKTLTAFVASNRRMLAHLESRTGGGQCR